MLEGGPSGGKKSILHKNILSRYSPEPSACPEGRGVRSPSTLRQAQGTASSGTGGRCPELVEGLGGPDRGVGGVRARSGVRLFPIGRKTALTGMPVKPPSLLSLYGSGEQ